MTIQETLNTATLAFLCAGGLFGVGSMARRAVRSVGHRRLMDRYQARAFRSAQLSELSPEPWTTRPYGNFRPEDVSDG